MLCVMKCWFWIVKETMTIMWRVYPFIQFDWISTIITLQLPQRVAIYCFKQNACIKQMRHLVWKGWKSKVQDPQVVANILLMLSPTQSTPFQRTLCLCAEVKLSKSWPIMLLNTQTKQWQHHYRLTLQFLLMEKQSTQLHYYISSWKFQFPILSSVIKSA